MHNPADAREAAEIVRDAAGAGRRLEIRGGGSKAAYGGPPPTAAAILHTGRLAAVVDYDPQEFVLTAGAGARLADIEALLAAHDQRLAFEPPDLGPLLGAPAGAATLGGVLAANLAGPRRIQAGAARDHLLGFEAVSGGGVAFKSGGRVVKNVTGFDLCKLMAGSWGALALLTTVTLRTAPRPRATATLRLAGLSADQAMGAFGAAMRLPLELSGAAWTPEATLLRIEGFPASVTARTARLAATLAPFGAGEVLDAADDVWRRLADLRPLTGAPGALWRLSVPPARGAEALAGLAEPVSPALVDWAGGLVWLRLAATPAARVRAVAERLGGHATRVQADGGEAAPAFHPQPPALAALGARVRAAFDPTRVFVGRREAAA